MLITKKNVVNNNVLVTEIFVIDNQIANHMLLCTNNGIALLYSCNVREMCNEVKY